MTMATKETTNFRTGDMVPVIFPAGNVAECRIDFAGRENNETFIEIVDVNGVFTLVGKADGSWLFDADGVEEYARFEDGTFILF
jgi:hypothetical protein